MKHRTIRMAGLLLTVVAFCLMGRTAAAGPPSAVIEGLNAKFIEVMRDGPNLGYDGRYMVLAPTLDAAFNFADMTRVSVGRYWKDLTDDQREQLIAAFRAYSLATYAARFKEFSGERFEVLDEQAAQQNSIRVNSQIVTGDGEAIRIDYLLQLIDGQHRIIDVYLKSSVSELAVRRSEFGSVLSKQGADGLIAALNDKAAQLAKEAQSAEAASTQ